jgi:hypothetical protein
LQQATSAIKADSSDAVAGTKAPSAPQCIVMFGWMDASIKHLHKYTQGWQQLVSVL